MKHLENLDIMQLAQNCLNLLLISVVIFICAKWLLEFAEQHSHFWICWYMITQGTMSHLAIQILINE